MSSQCKTTSHGSLGGLPDGNPYGKPDGWSGDGPGGWSGDGPGGWPGGGPDNTPSGRPSYSPHSGAASLCSDSASADPAINDLGGVIHGQESLTDEFGRRITYARLSLTDRCNFRCLYCMPKEGLPYVRHANILSYEELLRLTTILTKLGVTHYKITGGEPFCRKGAVDFIETLANMPGVQGVSVTTNGSLALPYLERLAQSGVTAITFSCDASSAPIFTKITNCTGQHATPEHIFEAMQAAAALGMQVKMNTVPLSGINEQELLPLARFTMERGYHIRFIELMPVGQGKTLCGVAPDAIFAKMEQAFGPLTPLTKKTGNGPARNYTAHGYSGVIGFISAMSGRFCGECNRVRITSTGFLKACLCHDIGVDLAPHLRSGGTDEALAKRIHEAVALKPSGHAFSFEDTQISPFSMSSVGG